MPRYKITVEYDGSKFCGWQRQQSDAVDSDPELKHSVQGAIEKALLQMTQEEVLVEGAGRTDAGVHALGQVAHFDLTVAREPQRLQAGLNFYLRPTGAVIRDVQMASDGFHARFSAISRQYRYIILNRRAPSSLLLQRVWHVPEVLHVDAMEEASQSFLGTHCFNAFRAAACQSKNPVKTLNHFELVRHDECLEWVVQARSFLHNQVRIMVGTLVWIGKGKLPVSAVQTALEAGKRCQAGPTAPPFGLYLDEVKYHPDGQ